MAKPSGPHAALVSLRKLLAESPAAREVATLATGVAVAVSTVAMMGAVFEHSPSRRPVDRATCDCTCWDAAFKNGYGTTGYKTAHVSFDERLPALAAWLAAAFLLATSLARHMWTTALAGEARPLMLLAILAQLYSHHYSFWAVCNYLNEAIWGFLAVQIIFAATEVAATVAAASQLSSKAPLAPRALWVMVGVSAAHAYHNSVDWTTSNIGMLLMLIADVLQAAVAGRYLLACMGGGAPAAATATGSNSLPASPMAAAAALKLAYDDRAFDVGGGAAANDGGEGGEPGRRRRRVAAAPPYTYRQLKVDAAATALCVCAFSIALRLWQAVSHEFPQGTRR
jgi:hypothetical protein